MLRRQAPTQGWALRELAERVHAHCGHSRLRAQRLARGWTLDQLIAEMTAVTTVGHNLVPSRVSRWERGAECPSRDYMDALCRVYQTGPVDLGLARDYGAPAPRLTYQGSTSAVPVRIGSSAMPEVPDPARTDELESEGGHGDWSHAADPRDGVAALRRRLDETLSGSSLSDATVAYKEAVAAEYGRTYKTEPAAAFLGNVLEDLNDVQVLTDRKLPSGQRRDLCAVIARLAGLVSMTMVNLGRYREAREWVHTARLAADEAEAAVLRAWVATRGAVASLYLGDPEGAVAAAREAETLTRSNPSDVTAMAWAIIARAEGVMTQAAGARRALHRAESVFNAVHGVPDNTAYRFTTGQLHFFASHTLTALGETRAAWQAQDQALAEFGPNERLDPTLVRLDRALCMITDGDLNGGVDYATTLLLDLATEYRPTIVLRRATAIAAAIPAARRTKPVVRALHEVLAISPGSST